jgi:aminoglycoside/choline kinase family phosphotransferase
LPDSRRDDPRLDLLRHWLESELGWRGCGLAPASADASFRRYFRVTRDDATVIAMDAPPDKEDVEPYLRVAGVLEAIGVNAPRMIARNAADGFLLLSDLGSTTYLEALADPARAGRSIAMRSRRWYASRPGAGNTWRCCRPTTSACCGPRCGSSRTGC